MKRKILYILLFITSIGLFACSKTEIEKKPVIIEEKNNEFIPNADNLKEISYYPDEASDSDVKSVEINETDKSDEKEIEKMTIQLEGMDEDINVKSRKSDLGYQLYYDIDRFVFTNDDGRDNYMAENVNPEIIPYVYVSISRIKGTDAKEYLNQLEDSLKEENKDVKINEPIDLSDQVRAEHIYVRAGLEWNSAIRNFYIIDLADDILLIETQFFVEAEEGYGARIHYMLETLRLQ